MRCGGGKGQGISASSGFWCCVQGAFFLGGVNEFRDWGHDGMVGLELEVGRGVREGFRTPRLTRACGRRTSVCIQNKRPGAGRASSSSRQCDTCARLATAVASMTAMGFEAKSSRLPWWG